MVTIGGKVLGGGRTFITMEAGPTHSGVESAKRLAEAAAKAGADAIKFQILDPDRLVADRSIEISYEVLVDRETGRSETVSEPVYNLLKRRSLSREEWGHVKSHCDDLGLAFFATVGFPEEVEFLAEIGCASVKIASADLDHYPLIRLAARTGMCLQIDTGQSTIGEVENAVDMIRAEGNENIIIHHCPSGYPAHLESINLHVLQSLKQLFPYPIAFSDHTPGWEMDIAAVALGADLVEKTITEDRTTRSIEHIMSLEPQDAATFVRAIRNLETALGGRRRLMTDQERAKRRNNRRSIFAARDLAKGSVIVESDLDYRRPGFGISPAQVDLVLGRRTTCAIPAGTPLAWTDLTAAEQESSNK